ncbi:MAG: trypsin-like peptidase domain-containing protein [Candidatus Wildermuthbacteria bacterium]|nr:trypsin-like peptidase domain-containing protein [Candidatus Wildermuthbacteria bacterium]
MKSALSSFIIASTIISALVGGAAGFGAGYLLYTGDISLGNSAQNRSTVDVVEEESAVVEAVEKVSPAVVSIIITKDVPASGSGNRSNPFNDDFFRRFFGEDFGFPDSGDEGNTEEKEVGGGSGFIVSSDGYIATNKHVVFDEKAKYTVLLNDGTRHEAKVLARDPLSDIAVVKIKGNNFPTLDLGDSSYLKVGQTVIAIGNALGEFKNTVSKGVVSGLSRSITASGAGFGTEQLFGVIQSDASINPGNSGGPLLNIKGQAIGMNTAMAQGAENIGFAIPINEVKSAIESVKAKGRIVRPWLGIRYAQITKPIAEANDLPVEEGAWINRENSRNPAVVQGSPADKAGIKEGDIILAIDGVKTNERNPFAALIRTKQPGDKIILKVLRDGKTLEVSVVLEEFSGN